MWYPKSIELGLESVFETITFWLDSFAICSVILPIILLLSILNKTFSTDLKVLFLYVTICLFADLVNDVLVRNSFSNFPSINVFTYVEFTTLAALYVLLILKIRYTKIFFAVLIIYTMFYWYYYFLSFPDKNLYSPLIESAVIIMLSILAFFKMIENVNHAVLTDYYFFWINTAFLIYFSGSLFVFLFEEKILRGGNILTHLWLLHSLFLILKNLFIAIGIAKWKKSRLSLK